MKNQGSRTPHQRKSNFLVVNPREMEMCKLLKKELKIIVFKELQVETNRQQNDIMKIIQEKIGKANKEIIIKKRVKEKFWN
jgi:hypothetical protein